MREPSLSRLDASKRRSNQSAEDSPLLSFSRCGAAGIQSAQSPQIDGKARKFSLSLIMEPWKVERGSWRE
jgi:hypothetical protein